MYKTNTSYLSYLEMRVPRSLHISHTPNVKNISESLEKGNNYEEVIDICFTRLEGVASPQPLLSLCGILATTHLHGRYASRLKLVRYPLDQKKENSKRKKVSEKKKRQ
uniref:Uncharacterized protein n=1 Tax=Lactuca sativa TaxID=4236 RepID=A0A9R1XVS6_LACSA|nr:hypothetical protein LSAT_V11C200061240 [Lactuca sativa]